MDLRDTILSPISLTGLSDIIREVVRSEVANLDLHGKEKLLTSKEAINVFQPSITVQTLNNWIKQGFIPVRRIGGRNYFLLSEIIESAKKVHKFSRLKKFGL